MKLPIILTLAVWVSSLAFGSSNFCRKKVNDIAVQHERQWIKQNEKANPQDLLSVKIFTDEHGKDSNWSKEVGTHTKFGIFVESLKTQSNVHWEITLDPKTCKVVAKPERITPP